MKESLKQNIKLSSYTIFDSIRRVVLIIGSVIILLIAFGNTLTWHLQKLWGGSAELWQCIFDRLFAAFDSDEKAYSIYGSLVLHNCVYWGVGLLMLVLDLTGQPRFLARYKIQPNQSLATNIPRRKLIKTVALTLFNLTAVNFAYFHAGYCLMKRRGSPLSGPLPSFYRVALEFAVFIICEEIAFYYGHRLLHHRAIYKYVHKIHHEWTASISIAAVYAHPLEHVISNLSPAFLGPVLCGSHIAVMHLWSALAIINTLNAHCGYHFPFFPSPEAHDFHHYKFTNNFGVMGVLDRLHGTDELFRRSPNYKHHIMMLTLTPPREYFPIDDEEQKKSENICMEEDDEPEKKSLLEGRETTRATAST